ncbi:HD-GYP domain-containing protein [Paenibacillus turpanensis]|uniref:HD-GYP domain-containing protein n=1 Tax=Paenibacillus turpanensis TaxID=2689078 RepID=UPI00140A9AB2|nr:HD-GYP domain-containing protein [Paenibacillus turpanensis]
MVQSVRTKLEDWLERPVRIIAAYAAVVPMYALLPSMELERFLHNLLFLLTGILEGVSFWKQRSLLLFPLSLSVTLLEFWHKDAALHHEWQMIAIQLLVHFTTALLAKGLVLYFMQAGRNGADMIIALSKSLDSRDPYTAFHSGSVAAYAVQLASAMKLPQRSIDAIYIGGLLHDIGKIGVPESVLTKPSKLSEYEYQAIQQHPMLGYEILKHIPKFRRNGVLEMVLHHHERYDGKGYPYGLKGEQIPLHARIIAVADAYDAMMSKRIYRSCEPGHDFALNEIRKCRGSQFDPQIADVFIHMLEQGQIHRPSPLTQIESLAS